ncbi:hypothetical protein AB434_1795 [Heyndrickxia coagulans]|jgi:hypothetical protein|uniref:Uncharacterized protein n=1 Tax=Heyndrickxia coagulans TaxID=1398 RepID=A0AAN0T7M6_HEYCO|nr:hypothetical protein SB48_HM08orf05645 [Heyndrickxia coagulans]AKN54200.1 hypothetical protein AB434_1795 [Heyndrickxia coagulans]ATW84191.1 hypothetical protein CIW84_15010 [Heyndrickxia coagulans]KGB30477.1 hypothetical protein IE89_04615 [Heyndrickxia coagulans]KXT20960.1 hypothetical protein UZ35_06905 [Heyndrickxia coagulans]
MRSKKSNNIWLQPQSKGANQTGLFALIILDFSLKQGKRIRRWKVPRRVKKTYAGKKRRQPGIKGQEMNEGLPANRMVILYSPV